MKLKNKDNHTFNVSFLHIPHRYYREYAISPMPGGEDIGQAISGMAKEGILRGIELAAPELKCAGFDIENLCFGAAIVFTDKKDFKNMPHIRVSEQWGFDSEIHREEA